MPVPWVQIVQLMPSIVEVSRELLKRSRRGGAAPMPGEAANDTNPADVSALQARIVALEENERRQAELVTRMVEQLAQLTTAVTALHRQMRLMVAGQVVTAAIAVAAIVFALR